jgi:tetratricopeptide (TPR) repeat protein
MFGLNRQVRKLLEEQGGGLAREGLTADDPSLIEVLPLSMLLNEAKETDTLAGRASGRKRSMLRLDSAILWLEVTRRSGEVRALSRAASAAEGALEFFGPNSAGWARARCEQGYAALLGAELFGDASLLDAAEDAFQDALSGSRRGLVAPHSEIGLLTLAGRRMVATGDAQAARVAAARFAQPIATLKTMSRRIRVARMLSVEGHIHRAQLLCDWGSRLSDAPLLRASVRDTQSAASGLTPDFEPLTIARIGFVRAAAQIAIGEVEEDAEICLAGVNLLDGVLSDLLLEHSPLDRAKGEFLRARGHQILGEISGDALSFERAIACFDQVEKITQNREGLVMRAQAAAQRALCLARTAEISGDVAVLNSAERALRSTLVSVSVARDPESWALLQLNLARLLLARLDITRKDRGERAGARAALSSALDVLSERNLRAMGRSASWTLDLVGAAMQGGDGLPL